jgi:Domain of unknown function (DUF4265)
MAVERHVHLLVEDLGGKPTQEPGHVIDLGGERFRLLHSPGFVQGIAAGDEFQILDEQGVFRVLHRSGNIAVQVFSEVPVEPMVGDFTRRVAEIGGVLDGRIEQGMVFTIPIQAGFQTIEALFNELVAAHAGMEWLYGNVYDPRDGMTPLDWWTAAK